MGFRFRTSIKLAPGVRLNLSRSGVSTTLGGRGLSVNVGRRGTRVTAGIPGTGFSYRAGGGGARGGSGGGAAGGSGEGCMGCGGGMVVLLLMMIGLCASPDPSAGRGAALADTAVSLSSHAYYAPQEPRETFYLHGTMNLRAGPSREHARVRTLPRGERVTLGPRDTRGWAPLYDGGGRPAGYLYRASSHVRSYAPRAQRPRAAPAHPSGASALCRDGTYSYSRSRRGTCSWHGGVRRWL